MKFFTLKDFISYSNPCFSCGERISLLFWTAEMSDPNNKASLKPLVTPEYTEVSLKISYRKSLNLRIYTPSNRIECSEMPDLADYIYSHNIFLQSYCNKCKSARSTNYLKWSLDKKFLKPTSLANESLMVKDETHTYHLYSSYSSEKSTINIWRTKDQSGMFKLATPLIEVYRFKNKEAFLEKMKVYILFS